MKDGWAVSRWTSRSLALALLGGVLSALAQETERPERVIPQRLLNAVAFGNRTFVAVGPGASILTSVDGANWINRSANLDNPVVGLNYDWETYICDGDSVTLVFDGSQMFRPLFPSTDLNGVAHGAPGFVAVGTYGRILSSPDGDRWRFVPSSTDAGLQGVTWGGGRFVAVGENGTILSSRDGVTWTRQNSGTERSLYGVASGKGTFIAVGDGGTLLSSSDAAHWSAAMCDDAPLRTVAFGNGVFLASAGFTSQYATASSDGKKWRQVFLPIQATTICFGNGLFVAAGLATAVSTDAQTWRESPKQASIPGLVSQSFRGLAGGDGLFVFAGLMGVSTSLDGLHLERRQLPDSKLMVGLLRSTETISTFQPIQHSAPFRDCIPFEIASKDHYEFRAYSWKQPFSGTEHGNTIVINGSVPFARTAVLGSEDGIVWRLLQPAATRLYPLPSGTTVAVRAKEGPALQKVPVQIGTQQLTVPLPSPTAGLIRVQASTNLVDWVEVGFLTNSNDHIMRFIGQDVDLYPKRFYRLLLP